MSTASAPASTTSLTCPTCARVIGCTPADRRVYAAIGAPRCCGRVLALPPVEPRPVGRPGSRRPPRAGVRADVRRPGLDEDLAVGLVDVSADGGCVRVTAPFLPGDELEVALVRADGRVVARVPAEVRWCRPIGGGLFAAGLAFRRPLGLTELAEVVK